MPQIQFEGLAQSLSRLPQVLKSIPDILRDPAANPIPAAILLGMVLVIALIVLSSVVLLVMRPSRDEEGLYGDEESAAIAAAGAEPAEPLAWLTMISIVVLVIAAVWVTTGITTADPSVCTSCHTATVHSTAKVGDPHKDVACVSCHETGGPVARATVNLATRMRHVVLARYGGGLAAGYGQPAASDACQGCHSSQIGGVSTNKVLGVRVSHKEPLAAGAQCVDCHVLKGGVVTSATIGMAPCLRCHDGKVAKAECGTCHLGDPAVAIRSSIPTAAMVSAQVPNPQCQGCHVDMTTCNACHGIAMPHSAEFKAYGHARAAAIDIWNNGAKGATTCRKCHYPGHDDCQRCHFGSFPSHPSPAWKTLHAGTWPGSSRSCPCHQWNPFDHAGMGFCQVCHAVNPATGKP